MHWGEAEMHSFSYTNDQVLYNQFSPYFLCWVSWLPIITNLCSLSQIRLNEYQLKNISLNYNICGIWNLFNNTRQRKYGLSKQLLHWWRTCKHILHLSYMCKQILCSRLITGFVIRLTRRVPLVEQELLTIPEHLSSPPVFSGGSCYSIFIFMCMFCRSLFVLLYFFFGHCVVSS
jgi:hypothetical protein